MTERLKDLYGRLVRQSGIYLKTDMEYLIHAGFWSNLNAFIVAVFSFGLYVAFAHFLSKDAYGTYQYLLSLFTIASAFTLTGMNSAVVRAVAQGHEGTVRASVTLQLKYGLIPFAGCLIGAAYYWHAGNLLLAAGLVLIGVGTPILYAFNTFNSFFVGKKDFRRSTLYGLLFNVLYYGALVLATIFSPHPLVMLGVNLGVQVVVFFFFYRHILKKYNLNQSVDNESLSYGLHLSAMNVFGAVAGQVSSIFTFHFLGPIALALYSFAGAVPDRLSNICFKFLGGAALSRFSERSVHEVQSSLMRKMLLVTAAGVAVGGTYAAFAPLFFKLFFPMYMDAVPYSIAYTVGLAISGSYFLPTTALTALKRTRELYILSIVGPAMQILLPLAGILLFGLWGLVIGQTLTLFFIITLATFLVLRIKE